jgi:copper chaperone
MQFHVENMTCGGCARSVAKAIQSVDPAAKVEADPAARSVVVTTASPRAAIEAALAEAGYPAATQSAA